MKPFLAQLFSISTGFVVLGGFCAAASGQISVERVRSFGDANQSGKSPTAPLIEGSGGMLYGVTFQGGVFGAGTVYKMNRDGSGFTLLHSFSTNLVDGRSIKSPLLLGTNGMLYGTTDIGGSNNVGTVFMLNTNGSNYVVLHSFSTNGNDGTRPSSAGLVQALDGTLYGVTQLGGTNGAGTIFKLSPTGAGYTVVYSFRTDGVDGRNPVASLVRGKDGALYGVTINGGANSFGTVFKLNPATGVPVILRNLYASATDAYWPSGALMQGQDNLLYGTASGGVYDLGAVFKLDTNGNNYAVLKSLGPGAADAQDPEWGLVQGTNGLLYGTTYNGGYDDNGTVFRLNTNGTVLTVIHQLNPDALIPEGYNPKASLLLASDGALYGSTYLGGANNFGTLFTLNQDGTNYATLHQFSPGGDDPSRPDATLVQGRDGALYGTSWLGGGNGVGAVFKLNKDWNGYAILRRFKADGLDGKHPEAPLLQGQDGAFYGTTFDGGSNGVGTVFKLNSDGAGYNLLHHFLTNGADGANPYAGLAQGGDGVLYGTTRSGGSNNLGTIYRLSTNGTGYATLHHFSTNVNDGSLPFAGLLLTNGLLYGTTDSGGATGKGTVFKLNTNGAGFALLHSFAAGSTNGQNPQATLIAGSGGWLYGTTINGGNASGNIFRIKEDGTGYTNLHNFVFGPGDGRFPSRAPLAQDRNGILYGTTPQGGSNVLGVCFRLNPDGSGYQVVYNFSTDGKGSRPQAGLVLADDGNLYGAATYGGDFDYGTVFRLNLVPPAPRFQSVALTNNSIAFIWNTITGRQYQVEYRTNLSQTNWLPVGNVVTATNVLTAGADVIAPGSQRFYRVGLLP